MPRGVVAFAGRINNEHGVHEQYKKEDLFNWKVWRGEIYTQGVARIRIEDAQNYSGKIPDKEKSYQRGDGGECGFFCCDIFESSILSNFLFYNFPEAVSIYQYKAASSLHFLFLLQLHGYC